MMSASQARASERCADLNEFRRRVSRNSFAMQKRTVPCRTIQSAIVKLSKVSAPCHTATGTHVPYGITQRYVPPDGSDISTFTPAN